MHLRQLGFMYSACEPFPKIQERKQSSKETRDLRYTYQN